MPAPPCSASETTLAILAGGEGARMGRPKGELRVFGRPILEHLHAQLAWPGPTALITAPGRERPPGCERFDHEWIDAVLGQGPLRGILTALEHARTPRIAVLTVDMPLVRREQIEWLGSAMQQDDLALMCRRVAAGEDRPVEPFPMIVATEALAPIRSRVERRVLSVVKLLEEPHFVARDIPPAWGDQVWTNLNRPSDLDRFLRAGAS